MRSSTQPRHSDLSHALLVGRRAPGHMTCHGHCKPNFTGGPSFSPQERDHSLASVDSQQCVQRQSPPPKPEPFLRADHPPGTRPGWQDTPHFTTSFRSHDFPRTADRLCRAEGLSPLWIQKAASHFHRSVRRYFWTTERVALCHSIATRSQSGS